jgi:hypothetical protein
VSGAIITPTIAYGKGFGAFDIQGTLGVTLPINTDFPHASPSKIGLFWPHNSTGNGTVAG